MGYPDYNKPFQLFCDASDIGAGAVLKQKDRILGLYSYKSNKTEVKYHTQEKEFLSILKSYEHFKRIIFCALTTVFTDSKNLLALPDNSNKRIQRWKILLDQYNIELK